MRNMLAFLAAGTLTLVGMGWYLNWYQVQTAPTTSGHRQVKIDIDTAKIGEDINRGSERLQEMLEKSRKEAEAKAAKEAETATASAAAASKDKEEKIDPK